MKDGFIKVASATPKVKVADCIYNADRILNIIKECKKEEVRVLVFPELCLTGYTCNDLFLQDVLIDSAKEQLKRIIETTYYSDMLIFVGLPICYLNKLYNVTAVVQKGELLGIIPKVNIPNYSEFYELRHFNQGIEKPEYIDFWENGEKVPFGTNILFRCKNLPELIIGAEICEDLWVQCPPSIRHSMAGASVIVNLSASNEITSKDMYRRELVKSQSARLVCGYIYADAGEGESTTDLVFCGHNLIYENGIMLAESKRFENEIIMSEIDVFKINAERRRMTTFTTQIKSDYFIIDYSYDLCKNRMPITELTRFIDKSPFVPSNKEERNRRCEEILNIQAFGLKKRLEHTNCKCAVIGISGGLDSTLALLVTVRAFDMLKIERNNIKAVTMPCFGTTNRTYTNAVKLIKNFGVEFIEINIQDAVRLHFKDIQHDENLHDVTYENSQARERTKVLMNIANKNNGLVVGTGDMSELALGWATYNGDHMSMYGVNCSVPKTLVRYLISYYIETLNNKEICDALYDILNTPVSPELLPPKEDGTISQKTEDIVGPYELHDFFLYYIMRFGMKPEKIYRLAVYAFGDEYDKKTIEKWLKIFYKRFFSQQFKRSCLPDGPKVGTVSLSPRGDLRMPSDACSNLWI